MRLVRFQRGSVGAFGRLEADQIVPVAGATLTEALEGNSAGDPLPLASLRLLAPIARPGKILGIGVNYAAHAAESVSFVNTSRPEVQKWFNKQATAVNGPYEAVHLPKVSAQLDYEGELVVVIGKHGRHVPRARAMEIVAGFCVGGDYSVRDWQKASQTMIMGKGFDTHAVFGPALVTLDEAGDISGAEIRTYINGELRQSGKPAQMIHDIAAQIEHLTAAFTLEPGDVIYTGTPAGVGAGFDPPKWLKAGDTVRVEIDGLGHIENKVVEEPET
ncbi:MAG: fumarylacetoacetate hydrolase family protein, partial [Hyphomonas sp.]|uniref:fumarylacetoacetate hydrolase family protein n=1 Tax=Hyphomonas sp. TaxID=87 RepID=UPI0034A0224A